jgi:hypothetical protein
MTTILGQPQALVQRRRKSQTTADNRDRLVRVLPGAPEFMTDRVAAQICCVNLKMIELWIKTGVWPLPAVVRATTLYFKSLDVECWLNSGKWPSCARFRAVAYQSPDGVTWRVPLRPRHHSLTEDAD